MLPGQISEIAPTHDESSRRPGDTGEFVTCRERALAQFKAMVDAAGRTIGLTAIAREVNGRETMEHTPQQPLRPIEPQSPRRAETPASARVNVATLRKRAADFEQKKQLDKAMAVYHEILEIFDAGGDHDVDVNLYNRVGDLLARQGNTSEAVRLYERALDLYAEGGFVNNAIALCNKILRSAPDCAIVYYKLGKLSAAKGLHADAKANFLVYADRMQESGQMEEAFRALKELADLCTDQDDIRLMLAEQFAMADRKTEALEQLQALHARYDARGRTAEAQATFDRMREIDPSAETSSVAVRKRKKTDGLVFIDLDAPAPPNLTLGLPGVGRQRAWS